MNDFSVEQFEKALQACWKSGQTPKWLPIDRWKSLLLDDIVRTGNSRRYDALRKAVKNAESRLARDFAYKPRCTVQEPTSSTPPYGVYRPQGERL